MQHIPYTVRRPVTRQVVNKYQVQVCNWQRQEMVRQIPVTTCRMEYEEHVEQVPVRTCKWLAETSTVMRPHCVAKWVPYTCTQLAPRMVMMTSPCSGCASAAPVAAHYAPRAGAGQPTTTLKPVVPDQPVQDASEGAQGKDGGGSVLKGTPDLNAPQSSDEGGVGEEPADKAPQLPPRQPYNGPFRPDPRA